MEKGKNRRKRRKKRGVNMGGKGKERMYCLNEIKKTRTEGKEKRMDRIKGDKKSGMKVGERGKGWKIVMRRK